ncbi:uncharacterized protein MONOS_18692 [Monocercomonoides exilis]|uniref:uncharacterized protein n=1 Tax=Monocercomonoides exilis TaxID=2049356 RepID=UPI003559C724|nr:hypothetical protein MONOS_18692 [Monocercomonoides exilis]
MSGVKRNEDIWRCCQKRRGSMKHGMWKHCFFYEHFRKKLGEMGNRRVFGRMIQAEKTEENGERNFCGIFFNKNLFGSSSRRGRIRGTQAQ